MWEALFWPLLKLLAGMSAGLLLGNMLEAMRWTDYLARLAAPVARFAHLGPVSATAFALAFASPAAANGLLSEKFALSQISRTELLLANILNGLPAWLGHMPGIFFILWPALGPYALAYMAITFLAAVLRTFCVMLLGRIVLAPCAEKPANRPPGNESLIIRLRTGFAKAWNRFLKRLLPMAYFTVPFYLLMFFAQRYGYFKLLEQWLADNLAWLSFIKPEAMGLMALQLAAEMGATLGAAGAILENGALSGHDVVAAMLAGNILATPMRAIRHQLPVYAGFYKAPMAVRLVLANQLARAASMVVALAAYEIGSGNWWSMDKMEDI